MMTCSADHTTCRFGSAHTHAMIRTLWAWQLARWAAPASEGQEDG